MKIQLKEWRVQNLTFKMRKSSIRKNHFSLSIGNTLFEDNLKCFGVGFCMEINDKDFKIKVEMLFRFETDINLDEEFKKSDFIRINAPAIAYPYVRSFISNLTLQAGFSPVILPSVNFVQLVKEENGKISVE